MTDESDTDPLASTLERLSTEADTCTLAQFQEMAGRIRSDPGFEQALLQGQALANEKRLVTLSLLDERGTLCACEIQAALDCTNATVSHHMSCLERADLVSSHREGKWKYYELTADGQALTQEVLP